MTRHLPCVTALTAPYPPLPSPPLPPPSPPTLITCVATVQVACALDAGARGELTGDQARLVARHIAGLRPDLSLSGYLDRTPTGVAAVELDVNPVAADMSPRPVGVEVEMVPVDAVPPPPPAPVPDPDEVALAAGDAMLAIQKRAAHLAAQPDNEAMRGLASLRGHDGGGDRQADDDAAWEAMCKLAGSGMPMQLSTLLFQRGPMDARSVEFALDSQARRDFVHVLRDCMSVVTQDAHDPGSFRTVSVHDATLVAAAVDAPPTSVYVALRVPDATAPAPASGGAPPYLAARVVQAMRTRAELRVRMWGRGVDVDWWQTVESGDKEGAGRTWRQWAAGIASSVLTLDAALTVVLLVPLLPAVVTHIAPMAALYPLSLLVLAGLVAALVAAARRIPDTVPIGDTLGMDDRQRLDDIRLRTAAMHRSGCRSVAFFLVMTALLWLLQATLLALVLHGNFVFAAAAAGGASAVGSAYWQATRDVWAAANVQCYTRLLRQVTTAAAEPAGGLASLVDAGRLVVSFLSYFL
jgi:hypothetical protein